MKLAELNEETQEKILLLALESVERRLREAESAYAKHKDFRTALALDIAENNFKQLKEIAFG